MTLRSDNPGSKSGACPPPPRPPPADVFSGVCRPPAHCIQTLADRRSSQGGGSSEIPWGRALGGNSLLDCTGGAAGISAAGRGPGGGGGRPVFHEHVFQALGSLRQRNARVFESAVGNARALALAKLGSGGGGQEGGKGLYPCLVQLQCVVEMEEMFSVLSGAGAGARAGGGNGGHEIDDEVRRVFDGLGWCPACAACCTLGSAIFMYHEDVDIACFGCADHVARRSRYLGPSTVRLVC